MINTATIHPHGRGRRLCQWLLAGLVLLPWYSHAVQDVLPPDQVFRYEVSLDSGSSPEAILVEWNIRPAHYMYRERMGFATATEGVELGEAIMPAGEIHEDEFFGEMEIYRGKALIRIPVVSRAPDVRELELEIRSQGCADIGLCYPPQRWKTTVSFDSQGKAAGSGGLRALFGSRTARDSSEPLPPEEAFRPLVEVIDPFRLGVTWTIADDYYLYRDSLKASAAAGNPQPGTLIMPPGKQKTDEYFGETRVFYNEVLVEIPLSRATPEPTPMALVLEYQGCKEDGICYPPQTISIDVDLPAASNSDQPVARPAAGTPGTGTMVSEQDRLSHLIGTGNLALVMLTFTGLGLLLAFTPCVLPMVPILSGIIAGQGDNVTTRKAFMLSLTYVLGMALTYTIAGAVFAAAGQQVQSALQKPWIIISAAVLFVALALSMFGLYELRVPAAIQNRLSNAGGKQKAGTYIGTAVMGMLSALVVTSCVAPPLVATLAVIGQTGDVVRGASALFALSIGMGLPLLVIGTSAGRLIPKAGAWMNNVKGAFGFMMLGLAIWMLERILPANVILVMWAMLVFMAGVFLGAFQTLDTSSRAVHKLGKGLGLLAAFYGAVMLVGSLSGGTDPLRPLHFSTAQQQSAHLVFKRIKSVEDLQRELAQATSLGQPVMLDFYADWCVSCKEMEKYTFTDAGVLQALANTVTLQADVTANDDVDQKLLQYFGIYGPPTIVFFGPDGLERPDYRVVGYMSGAEFSRHINQFLQSPPPNP